MYTLCTRLQVCAYNLIAMMMNPQSLPFLDNDSQCSTAEEHPSSHLGKAAVQAGFILLEMVPTVEGEEKDAK